VPQRGEKRGLVDLANRNASLAYQNRFNQAAAAQYEALETLRAVLALPAVPRRIECFDISHVQGTDQVASLVVWEAGRPKRSDYRRFRVKTVEGSDDFAAMAEVVGRRYARLLEEGKDLPDLVLIDGGLGQLAAALDGLRKVGHADLPVIGLAKARGEKVPPPPPPIRMKHTYEGEAQLI